MAADERVRVFGEDVADSREALLANVEGKGGVFGTTHGLQREFGLARCFNTPLAESNIIGRAIGQAIRGLRPAPRSSSSTTSGPRCNRSRARRPRSAGARTAPSTRRSSCACRSAGTCRAASIWHSQSGESIFAHVPGLLIAFPSRARDAVGLLRAAFRCEDPVLFLEHKHLLRQPYARDPFPPADYVVPFGRGAVRRPGRDLTIVTWGAMVQKSLDAAARVQAELDREVEVIDLRSLVPWDRDLVADVGAAHRPAARRARGRPHLRVRRRGRGLGRPTSCSTSCARRSAGSARSTRTSRTSRRWRT